VEKKKKKNYLIGVEERGSLGKRGVVVPPSLFKKLVENFNST
jgi:hypothetical protein